MRFLLEPLLNAPQVAALRQALLADDAPWSSGAKTAGWHARTVKNNRQLDRQSPLQQRLAAEIETALAAHPLLQAAALPV
jgi:PKHD-type hydroxylase